MVLVLAGAVRHHGVRVCAHRIGHVVRRDRKWIRVQSGRRLGASVHHQRTRLRRASLFTRCDGLVHARHYSRRSNCICWLADFPHSPSRRLAKACVCRNTSSDSAASCNSISPIAQAQVGTSRSNSERAANRVLLAIAALAAIACLAIIHRAILAGRLARWLICRQRCRANNGRDN